MNRSEALVGQVLGGKYRLDALLGAGGFGAVYRGWHLLLDVPIAVKVAFTVDGTHGRRFRREARTLMTLRHPNIVRMYDYGQDESGHVYLVQEFVAGRSLASLLADCGPLSPELVVEVALQALAALAAAHRAGVVHRDVKPANLMLSDALGAPVVQLLDFGIAKMQEADGEQSDLTRPGGTPGTPAYMAPEQIHGHALPASDLYALGATLYCLLAGRKPYPYGIPKVFIAHLQEPVPELPPGVPAPLAQIVRRAMAKRPEARFADADEMAQALRRLAGAPGAVAAPGGRRSLPADDTVPSGPPFAVGGGWLGSASGAADPIERSSTSAEGRGVIESLPRSMSRRPVSRWVTGLAAIAGGGLLASMLWTSDGLEAGPADGGPAEVGASASASALEGVGGGGAPDGVDGDAGAVSEAADLWVIEAESPVARVVDAGRPEVQRQAAQVVRASAPRPPKARRSPRRRAKPEARPPRVADARTGSGADGLGEQRDQKARALSRAIDAALADCRCGPVPGLLDRLAGLDGPAAEGLRTDYTKKCVLVGLKDGCK